MKLRFKIQLTNGQKEAYDLAHRDDVKYLTLNYSRQCGKSTLAKVLVIEWLFKKKKKIGYVCRNYILAKRFFKDINTYIPKEYIKSSNASDLTLELITGSTLSLFSAESGDGLRGLTFHYLICDEFAFFNNGEDFWNEVLFPTIKVLGNKVIFISTPHGKQNIFHTMYLRGLDGKYPKYRTLEKNIYSDGLISKEDIEDLKKQIPPMAWQQEFMVKFLDSAYSFFSGFEECFKDYIYDWNCKQWCGIDLSSVGDDETIVTFVNEKNQTYQIKIEGTLDQKYSKIADILNNTKNLQKVYIECNGIGSPMINEIKKLVKNQNLIEEWTTTNESKNRILGQLALDISNKTIIFNVNNQPLFNQFSTFIYKLTKGGNVKLEASSGNHDDMVMSLAISLECKKNGLVSGIYSYKSRKSWR